MNRGEEDLCYKAHEIEVEEDFYPFGLSTDEDAQVYKDNEDLFTAHEVLLAARLGNALLLENRQLKEDRQTLHDKYTQQLEELQQGRYEMQVKLDSCQAHWESQVAELERDARELHSQVDRLTQSLCKAEKEKTRLKHEHSEQSNRLREQLRRAMEVEQTVTCKLKRLKDEMRERGNSRPEDEEIISALREQIARLVQREQTLEQRLKTSCQENEELRESVSSLHTRLDFQEQQCHTHTQQLAEAWHEVELSRARTQELQSQVDELQEEVALREKSHNDTSLLSELENSLDALGWSQDKEQEMRRSIVGEVSDPCENSAGLRELKDQNERLIAENTELKLHAGKMLDEEVVRQALKDRDDAIAKKTAMEAELLRTKHDMMCLNNQLLEAIQRKLELSQELEAWQDDIQIIINQQLKSQQQTEQLQKRPTGRMSFLHRSRRTSTISETGPGQNQSPWRDWLKLGK
ncbi:BICD family-like cargo adapter 1 [Triplophysa rosa]|uniref:Bicaudal D-related protein 1-like n=1 Tax=Triplophysa rosa TaxID=992332 RepID=A0A9W7WIZ0_TRIRA|nr:BICD family-like cargo adapter 1 [Triplophysa rosa]KAI7800760.1 putative bicaudal D-related protein 1-like [Triplophysa rosa]